MAGVVQTFAESSPVLEHLSFIDVGVAESYRYDIEGSLGGATWRALGQTVTADSGVVNPAVESLSILTRIVQCDTQRANNPEYIASKLRMGAKACAAEYTRTFFDGDDAVNVKEMRGLNSRIGASSALFRAIDASKVDTNGGFMDKSLSIVKDMIDFVDGPAADKRLIMSKRTRRLISDAVDLTGAGSFVRVQQTGGDLAVNTLLRFFEDVEIIVVEDDASGTEILAHDETRGSDTTTASLYCVHFGRSEGEGVMGLHNAQGGTFATTKIGQVNTQIEWNIEGKVGMVNFHPRAIARMSGVKSALSV